MEIPEFSSILKQRMLCNRICSVQHARAKISFGTFVIAVASPLVHISVIFFLFCIINAVINLVHSLYSEHLVPTPSRNQSHHNFHLLFTKLQMHGTLTKQFVLKISPQSGERERKFNQLKLPFLEV